MLRLGQQGQPGQPPDYGKLFAAEAENMQIVEHVWFLDAAEERLLKGKTATAALIPRRIALHEQPAATLTMLRQGAFNVGHTSIARIDYSGEWPGPRVSGLDLGLGPGAAGCRWLQAPVGGCWRISALYPPSFGEGYQQKAA
mgnify:CR=1 FL=1